MTVETDDFGQLIRECYNCDRVGCAGCDDLRQRIADALYDTYGQQDRHRSNAIADAVLAIVQPELDRLQKCVDRRGTILRSMERQAELTLAAVVEVCKERNSARAAIDRVCALHERREGDDGSSYCDLCSNHGDINWPCATIKALGTPTEATQEAA